MEALRDISTAASDEVQRIVVSPSAKGSDSVETGGMSEKETPQFDWLSHWYPINVVETLDPSKPHAAQLLGKNLVIWNDGPTVEGVKQVGEWHVFEDACPHRLGPLSEGRVEADGTLLCSYHGWRFDGEGECADLPYSPEQVAERQRGSCRARCGGLPTKVADGFIWVFPRPGPDGYAASERVALPLIDELHDPALEGRWKWKVPAGVRDFPCGWDMMVENTLDPAHFCAAHHGTLGNRYTDPAPYSFETTRGLDTETGFAVRGDFGVLEFQPPCLVKYVPNYAGMPFNGSLVLATYCVPTKPGWVRPLATVLNDREYSSPKPVLSERALSIFMAGLLPTWLGHVLSSVVLHQDAGLLYKQYRNLRERGYNPGFEAAQREASPPAAAPPAAAAAAAAETGREGKAAAASGDGAPTYEQLVYTPTSVDRGVLLFRQWLRTRGGDGVPWQCEDVLPPRGTEDIYDMWDAHTQHCQYCQDAYRNLEAAKYASVAVLGLSLLAMPDASPERTAIVLTSATAAGALHLFNGLFRRYEFSHADNDPWWSQSP